LNLVKGFFCIYWDDQVVFVFASINVLYYIYRFAYVESSLHPLGWSWLVRDEWSFWYVVGFGLPLFYWGFLDRCLLRRLACSSPSSMCPIRFWEEYNTGFIEWVGQCSFPFYFLEKFKESWYYFFEGLVESSWESVSFWTFIFGRLYCYFSFITCIDLLRWLLSSWFQFLMTHLIFNLLKSFSLSFFFFFF
jgi:hypothetical protein